MPNFDYIVRNENGARQTGSISAENYNKAIEKLQNEKLTIVTIKEADTSFDFVKPFLKRLSLEFEKFKNKVPITVLVFFTRQIATMFSAGLTIERSLHFLSQEEKNKKFKAALDKIEDDVKKGLLLSDALERHPGIFNNLYISLVYANILIGQGEINKSLEVLNRLKNIYPLNNVVSLSIAEILIENNLNLNYAKRLLEPLERHYSLNPNYLRLSSKLHTLQNNKFKAAISRSNYYQLLGDIGLALEVLSNSIRSNEMNIDQRKILEAKKLVIICGNPRPLEPLFGEKTCN